jgi:hypothetical protein
LEDLGIDGRMGGYDIEVHMKVIRWTGVDWTDLACDRDMRQVLVNTQKCDFQFHGIWGIYWLAEKAALVI